MSEVGILAHRGLSFLKAFHELHKAISSSVPSERPILHVSDALFRAIYCEMELAGLGKQDVNEVQTLSIYAIEVVRKEGVLK
jgi:hypothetical protein